MAELIPKVSVTRAKARREAQTQEPLYVHDVVETEKKSRARLRLADDSVVNVGPVTRFMLTRVDSASQQTTLELRYGRLRADVAKRTQPNGQFKVNTRTAVIGVVGTTVFVAIFPDETAVANLSSDFAARVEVRSSNPAIPDVLVLKPGQGTRIRLDRAPEPPRRWSREEIELALDDSRQFNP